MFLHIGADCSVPVKDIILILDYEDKMIKDSLHALKGIDAGDTRRSAVLTSLPQANLREVNDLKPEASAVAYYSPISKITLCKRLERVLGFS